jgi:hypothetical protein
VRTAIQRHGRLVIAAGIVLAVVAVSLGVILERGGGEASAASRYGQLPSWLPKAKVSTGRVLLATSARPRLAIEGDTVSIALPHGHVLATTVGPAVPEDGRFPVPSTSPCSFIVTFTAAAGAVPLQTSSFTILDELGHVHHPRVTAAHGRALPGSVRPGQTVTLDVSDVLPTGGGRLRWAPESSRPIASWDFDVEID